MTTDEVELSAETRDTLDRHNLRPLWEIEQEEFGKIDELKAGIWKWQDIQTAINQIAEDIPRGLSRCVAVPINASYDTALSQTLFIGIRVVLPGESPAPHRHGGNALRFTINGNPKMKSIVGGEEFAMEDNDLLTLPQWVWHGHENESEGEITWLDVHDTPLIIDALTIGNVFESRDNNQQPINKPSGYHESQYGEACPPNRTSKIPGPFEGIREPTPSYRFGWGEMSDSLDFVETNKNDHDPYDGVVLEYTNPARGSGPLFPTYGVFAQRLLKGEATRAHSHNSTEIYHVIEGSGQSIVNGEEINWSNRDIFVIPPNKAHYHNPDDRATLLKLTDKALLEAINFYYEVDRK